MSGEWPARAVPDQPYSAFPFLDGIFPSWVCVEKAFLRKRMRHFGGHATETLSQPRRPH
jgi:hypothetical protein